MNYVDVPSYLFGAQFKVQRILSATLRAAADHEINIAPEKYVDCLEDALQKIYEGTNKGPR